MSVCATCLQPGIRDGQHDCPGPGGIQLTRQLGRGLRVDIAPPRARMNLAQLASEKCGATIVGDDQINIADQVLYQVVGYDAESASLVLELVEDWRPKPTARLSEVDVEDIKARWREAYGKPGAAHPVTELREEQPGITVCTPIPAATLMQMSDVPSELLTEQQRTRADNAEERLRLAREALTRDGYFKAGEIGDDIAPRIVEWLTHHRERAEEAEDQLRRTRIELEHWQTSIVPELRAERDRLRAGEEPDWDPLTVPTPGQWIARFNSASAEERLDVAKRVIGYTATAGECFEMNHVRRLEKDRQAWATVARVRELRDTWLRMTLEPGQVRRLLDDITRALDGREPEETDATQPPPGFAPFTPKHVARNGTGDPLAVEPYRNDRNQDRWAFRCWGAATCEGWLSLDHTSQQSAERARDRHVTEAHPEEQPMPAATPCTATIEGPHTGNSKPVPCALPAHGDDQQHESAPEGPTRARLHWTDHHAGATPHRAWREESTP